MMSFISRCATITNFLSEIDFQNGGDIYASTNLLRFLASLSHPAYASPSDLLRGMFDEADQEEVLKGRRHFSVWAELTGEGEPVVCIGKRGNTPYSPVKLTVGDARHHLLRKPLMRLASHALDNLEAGWRLPEGLTTTTSSEPKETARRWWHLRQCLEAGAEYRDIAPRFERAHVVTNVPCAAYRHAPEFPQRVYDERLNIDRDAWSQAHLQEVRLPADDMLRSVEPHFWVVNYPAGYINEGSWQLDGSGYKSWEEIDSTAAAQLPS